MGNDFRNWTPAMVDEHNRRVAAGGKVPAGARSGLPGAVAAAQSATLPPDAEERSLSRLEVTLGLAAAPGGGRRVLLAERPTTDEAKLNKTEREWLGILRARGTEHLGIQDHTLKLANDCRYTPDFSGVGPNGELIFFEVKGGFIREDSFLKLKFAARKFTQFKFILCQKKKGQWTEVVVAP